MLLRIPRHVTFYYCWYFWSSRYLMRQFCSAQKRCLVLPYSSHISPSFTSALCIELFVRPRTSQLPCVACCKSPAQSGHDIDMLLYDSPQSFTSRGGETRAAANMKGNSEHTCTCVILLRQPTGIIATLQWWLWWHKSKTLISDALQNPYRRVLPFMANVWHAQHSFNIQSISSHKKTVEGQASPD